MKSFYGYVRVSTPRQGLGVSLDQQRAAIAAFAERHDLHISDWFEEQETAAKSGRPIFGRMVAALRAKKADGVVIHKIDRSARNLRDWADLAELIDSGCEIFFATESLDMNSRGGRLSADIQAVVAADYVRNLREEARKGIYGRLKQGFYPMRAPIGYLDRGAGRVKEVDPVAGPMVTRAFELYATGGYSLNTLRQRLFGEGLRNCVGRMLSLNGISIVLRNPFYTGVIRIKKTGAFFKGAHEPLISVAIFERVQAILQGKVAPRTRHHNFAFQRLLRCASCRHHLTGEQRKGYIYYRCHTARCAGTCVAEPRVWTVVLSAYEAATNFSQEELDQIAVELTRLCSAAGAAAQAMHQALDMSRTQINTRLDNLTDAFVDRLIDQTAYEQRRGKLLLEIRRIEEQLAGIGTSGEAIRGHVDETFGLLKTLRLSARTLAGGRKRELLLRTISDFSVDQKNVVVELVSPLQELRNRATFPSGGPYRGDFRTFLSFGVQF